MVAETSGRHRGYGKPRSDAGIACQAAAVGRDGSHGKCFGLNNGIRCCDQNCFFRIGSCKLSHCCESIFEDRSSGNPHATFYWSRRGGSRLWRTRWRLPWGLPLSRFRSTNLRTACCEKVSANFNSLYPCESCETAKNQKFP